MRIQPIYSYYELHDKTNVMSCPQMPEDTFVKSSSFKGYRMIPFLEGEIPYTEKNLKQFNQFFTNLDYGLLEDLKKKTLSMLSHFEGKGYTFGLDFLIRTAEPEDMQSVHENNIFNLLPNIKFSEENKPNVLELLKRLGKQPIYNRRYYFEMFAASLQNENVPLLKAMIKDDDWQTFIFHKMDSNVFQERQLPIIRNGQQSSNPEIKELFSDKNLYNLLKKCQTIYITSGSQARNMFDLGLIHLYQTPLPYRNVVAENMVYSLLERSYVENKADYISEIPVTNEERTILRQNIKDVDIVNNAFKLRVEKIIERNGIETPEELLGCLNDRVMSEDLLTRPYKDTTILNKISEIPVTGENQQIITQIVEKLSKMPAFPDDDNFRRAALNAAKNGNSELLKLFDSKHIHYKNLLKNSDEIDNFPKNVRDILRNAKINNSYLTSYVNFPSELELYLAANPYIDINSKDKDGKTLLSAAIDNSSIPMLDFLAKRDDVDWNMVDDIGQNILMQSLQKMRNKNIPLSFEKHLIKILQELGRDKFDINFVNERNSCIPYTVLSSRSYNFPVFKELLGFPDIDTNLNPEDELPLILKFVHETDYFKELYQHPSTDTSFLTPVYIQKLIEQDVHIDNELMQFLNNQYTINLKNDIQNIYEEKGILDIDDFEYILDCKESVKIINMKFNIAGETIGHLLVDYYPNSNNPQEINRLKKIVRTINSKGFDFQAKDEFGKTPLDKAEEAENDMMKTLLQRYY